MWLLVFYVLLALGVSFLCSIMEAVLLRTSTSYIARAKQAGKRYGALWESLRSDIDRPLAAILSLNTIAHTVGAAGAGAQATSIFGEAYFGVISAILTLLILVLSEIVPKTLGALYWRQLAPASAEMINATVWLMYPLVVTGQAITRLISHGAPAHSISREEFVALAEAGVSEGTFHPEESATVNSVLRFRALAAEDIMTPRQVFFSLPETATVGEVLHRHHNMPFTRIPLFAGSPDNITGFIRKDDLLLAAVKQPPETLLSSMRRELHTVPDRLPLGALMQHMTQAQIQIVLLVDEYGDIRGLVTMEDLVETMLGIEIVDETDTSVDMQKLARELWRKRAQQMGLVDDGAGTD
ncbi:CNNM domain-containing protein [Haliea sp. E17]|uniref:CNNM domain-containing protein n=1 Tax=Haliea sp. E17 TaxID=3401576 RepID=UPI003AAE5653